MPVPDPNRCPLCGEPNRCAMALALESGQAQAPCWCTKIVFAPEVLSRVPDAARDKACICQRCATAAAAPPANG